MRREGFDVRPAHGGRAHALEDLAHAMGSLEFGWVVVSEHSPIAGQAIAASNIRQRTGATIVALERGRAIVSNPDAAEVLNPVDGVALIGSRTEVTDAEQLIGGG